MSKSAQAIIKPELLIWARTIARLKPEDVARKLGVKVEKFNSWESGNAQPTVKQLRRLAQIYHQTFAAFYLPAPPQSNYSIPHDYRRHVGKIITNISPELALDIRTSWERRDIVLDLFAEQGAAPPSFTATLNPKSSPELAGAEIRKLLGLTIEQQKEWRDNRIVFNWLRESIEAIGVLVFQSTKLQVNEIRGYSLDRTPLPIIVINRKDSYAGRSFTMLHELTHILMHNAGLCDLTNDEKTAPEDLKIEVFCNYVAGASLMPKDLLLTESAVAAHGSSVIWSDEEIKSLADTYGVSQEVVVRRLLILGLTTSGFYEAKRHQYQEALKRLPKQKGFVSPPVDAVSMSGKTYVRAVLDAFYSERITTSDAASYLGVKLKHLDYIANAVGVGQSRT